MAPLNKNFSTEIDFTDITELFENAVQKNSYKLSEKEVYQILEHTGAVLAPINELATKTGGYE